MGNKFGNFASRKEAEDELLEEGFVLTERKTFKKQDVTGGSLCEAPRPTTAIVEITSFKVDARYSDTGEAYEVFQHHFL